MESKAFYMCKYCGNRFNVVVTTHTAQYECDCEGFKEDARLRSIVENCEAALSEAKSNLEAHRSTSQHSKKLADLERELTYMKNWYKFY